jgi:hypothetical protein
VRIDIYYYLVARLIGAILYIEYIIVLSASPTIFYCILLYSTSRVI